MRGDSSTVGESDQRWANSTSASSSLTQQKRNFEIVSSRAYATDSVSLTGNDSYQRRGYRDDAEHRTHNHRQHQHRARPPQRSESPVVPDRWKQENRRAVLITTGIAVASVATTMIMFWSLRRKS